MPVWLTDASVLVQHGILLAALHLRWLGTIVPHEAPPL